MVNTNCQVVEYESDGMVEFPAPHVTLIRECRQQDGTLTVTYVPSAYDSMDTPTWSVGEHVTLALLVLIVGLATLVRKERG